MNNKIALIGCGWLGLPLAKSLLKKGYQVAGSTTSVEKLSQFRHIHSTISDSKQQTLL